MDTDVMKLRVAIPQGNGLFECREYDVPRSAEEVVVGLEGRSLSVRLAGGEWRQVRGTTLSVGPLIG